MEEEQQILNNRKKIIIISASIVLLLALIVGISYAYWQRTKVQEDKNVVASACFGVDLEGNEAINLSSLYPISSEEGMDYTPYTFTITNLCSEESTYVVNLESLAETTFLNTSIRVALDVNHKLYSEYKEGSKYYNDSKESRTLISGTLESNASVTYNLRLWIDENAPVTEQNKVFASKIVVLSGEEGKLIDPLIENLETTSTLESINITYNTNGDVVPVICKYGIEEGNYTNTVTSATPTNCNITGLTPETTYYYQVCTTTGKGTDCREGSASTKMIPKPISIVEIGDYIKMTPTSTSYTISKDLTGYTTDQTINPSELNLWRVIKKNEDGTIEVVSEEISSNFVYFTGGTGYMNYLVTLKQIAAQYTNTKYVQSTRHMGFTNQKETCTEATLEGCPADASDRVDEKLVQVAIGSLVGNNLNKNKDIYWLAGRYHNSDGKYLGGLSVCRGGYCDGGLLYDSGTSMSNGRSVRPILTLKAEIQIKSGDGQSEDTAYTLD